MKWDGMAWDVGFLVSSTVPAESIAWVVKAVRLLAVRNRYLFTLEEARFFFCLLACPYIHDMLLLGSLLYLGHLMGSAYIQRTHAWISMISPFVPFFPIFFPLIFTLSAWVSFLCSLARRTYSLDADSRRGRAPGWSRVVAGSSPIRRGWAAAFPHLYSRCTYIDMYVHS